ncbi:MAG: class I SAM-dependent methyltransferase [Leptospirillia bacterium]
MSVSQPQPEGVAGTAFLIACFRMWGAAERPALYDDPVTPYLITPDNEAAARTAADTFPPAPHMVRLRTRYFDDEVHAAIDRGVRQVVLMGAGLDTRAARIGGNRVRYIEIDNEVTLAYKWSALSCRGIEPDVRYVPGDYTTDDLDPMLREGGFDFLAPALFLWEGNTAYLTKEAMETVLEKMLGTTRNATVALDYMGEQVIRRTTGHTELDAYIDHLEQKGAPWVCGFDDITPLAERLGCEITSQETAAALWERWVPGSAVPSPLFSHYRVATLKRRA